MFRLGLQIPSFTYPGVADDALFERVSDIALTAEESGFDSVFVMDHFYQLPLLGPPTLNMMESYTLLSALAARTTRVQLGALVTGVTYRNPAVLAKEVTTLDVISRGRAILGIGAGVEQPTFWGYERKLPMTAVREAVEVCRRMFAGEAVTLQGREISVEGAKLNFTPFRRDLPILIAARGRNMLELAGELADIVHLASFFVNAGHHRENLEHVKRGAERAGRRMGTFEIDISMPCSVSDDRNAARRAAKRPAAQGILWTAAAERYSRERKDWVRPKQFSVPEHVIEALASWDFWTQAHFPDRLADLISDDVLDQFALAGTPEECAERLRALQRELREVTGVRIYAVPPAGKPLFDGYVDMVKGFGRVARLVNAGVASAGAPARSAVA
jgi:alkanesulfonate monooxygenase SsuD/methylene tetrahydromethanopterin reductase-like flavin-dependent oxidoreductase (luciferase family)